MYKYCFVPQCRSTTKSTPQKLFIFVPLDVKRRKLWMTAARRNYNDLSVKSKVYCCEDHFDLEKDMENFMEVKLMGTQIRMEKKAVPHKFHCQMDRCNMPKIQRTTSVNRQRREYVEFILSVPSTSTVLCLTNHKLATSAINLQNCKIDDTIITEFDNMKEVKQELAVSGSLDNYPKCKYVNEEELNMECRNKIKQEAVDSYTDSGIYKDLEQDMKVFIKDEIDIVYNDFDYSEEKSYGALGAESSKEATTARDSVNKSSQTIVS